MPAPTADSAYSPHREAMISALEQERGVRVKCSSREQATRFRHMCYTLRSRDRSRKARMLGAEEAHLVTTDYDRLELKLEPAPHRSPTAFDVIIQKMVSDVEIEGLD